MAKHRIDSTSRAKNTQKRPLRPALIASEYTLSDYSTFLEHLLVGLVDESIPVALVCPLNSNIDSTIAGAIEVIRHPALQLPLAERLNRNILIDQLSRFNPTILHCLCETKALLTQRLAQQLNLPYLLAVNSLAKGRGQLHIFSKYCAKIITPAKSIADNLTKTYSRFANRIVQINIGTFVDEKTTCFSRPSRLAVLVIAYPLDDPNHLKNLFNAARHLIIDSHEFMILVMGSDRQESQLRKLLAALGLSHIVTIVPRLSSSRPVLAAGDIFILPQPSNAFNPLLLEAMSVGTTVAACKGGVDDLIIENKTAVLFDPNDEQSIYRTLQKLLSQREFARQIANQAQQYLKENHSVSNMVSAILKTYREAQDHS